MSPAGGDERPGEGGGPRMHRGVSSIATAGAAAGQDLGAESGSRKRKAIVMPRDSGSLVGNGEHLEVACEESQRVLKEIEDLRAQLDDDVKELGYCEANQKLRVELALKAKEIQCLRKHNEEMQAKYDGMRKPGEDLQGKNDSLVKWNEVLQTSKRVVNWEPQAKNGGLTMQNEELKAKNDCLMLQNVELQAKNDGLAKHNEELQAKNVGLVKQNAELQTIRDGTRKRNRDLQAKNDGLIKRSEELQAKNDGLRKRNDMLQLQDKNDGLTKPIEELEAKNDGRRKQIQSTSSDLKDGLTGCTDIGTQISRDIILESVQCLKQAEPIQCQAASNLDEIGCLQAQVTKLETAVNRLLDNNRTLAESKAALKEEVAAYAADLERCRKKNEALESEKASTEELLAYLVEDSDADLDDTELNTRICDLMCTSRKSKSHSKKRKDRERDSKTNK